MIFWPPPAQQTQRTLPPHCTKRASRRWCIRQPEIVQAHVTMHVKWEFSTLSVLPSGMQNCGKNRFVFLWGVGGTRLLSFIFYFFLWSWGWKKNLTTGLRQRWSWNRECELWRERIWYDTVCINCNLISTFAIYYRRVLCKVPRQFPFQKKKKKKK